MNMEDYQRSCQRTAKSSGQNESLEAVATFALGLAGEAGEVCDLFKKHYAHGYELNRGKLAEELGDVLFYVSALCSTFGLSLGDVAEANIEKLRRRYPMGFDQERSIKREAA